MINYLKSEFLKQKHRFNLKLLWLSPFIAVALVIILMGGRFFMEGAFNWWYTMILPSTLSMIVSFTVSAEKKYNRHGLFAVSTNKKKTMDFTACNEHYFVTYYKFNLFYCSINSWNYYWCADAIYE